MNKKCYIYFIFLFIPFLNFGANKSWDGGASTTNWGDANNWGPSNGVPGTGDNVTIVTHASFNPVMGTGVQCVNFTMTSGSLDLGGNTLIITGDATFTAGTITNGTITFSGAATNIITFTGTTINTSVTINGSSGQFIFSGGSFGPLSINQTGSTNATGTGGCTFNGTVSLTITGTGNISIGSTTASTFQSTCDLNIAGNTGDFFLDRTTHNGNITVGNDNANGIVYFGNTAGCTLASGYTIDDNASGFLSGALKLKSFTQSGTTAQSITIGNVAEIWFESGTIFNANLSVTAPAIYFNGGTFHGTASFDFTGSTTVSCAGGCVFNGATTIGVSGSGEIRMANTTAADDFNSNLTIQHPNNPGRILVGNVFGATLAGNLTCTNSWRNYCFGCNNGTITFDGTGTSTIYGDGVYSIEFSNITMNKTGGGSVVLDEPIIISSFGLNLTSGIIYSTATNYVYLDPYCLSVTNASNTSHIDGPCIKEGDIAFTFPVGDNGQYHPISISDPGILLTDAFKAECVFGDPDPTYSRTSKDASLNHINKQMYWKLDRTAGSANVSVTLSWDANSGGIDNLTDLKVARWNTGTGIWKDEGNGGTTGNTTAGTITSLAAVTTFSPFALASGTANNPLPVQLTKFDAVQESEHSAKIFWETASETNTDYFNLEKSYNCEGWFIVEKVNAAGNSTVLKYYSVLDTAITKINYYRLKEVDNDGSFKYFGPVTLEAISALPLNTELTVFPNPIESNGQIIFKINSTSVVSLNIYNSLGQLVSKLIEQTAMENGEYTTTVPSLISGAYFIKLIANEKTLSNKMFSVSQ